MYFTYNSNKEAKLLSLIIKTVNLKISSAKIEEIKEIIFLENKEENKKFVWQGTYEEHLKEINSSSDFLLTFKEKESNQIVGFALININNQSNIFELRRIVISKKRKGYGKESILGLMNYAFNKKNINRFWLDVYTDNKIAIELYKKLGMTFEGTLRESYKSERGYLDQMIFSILIEEFKIKYQNIHIIK